MSNPLMTINAELISLGQITMMLIRRAWALQGNIHVVIGMAVAAFQRIIGLEA
jgi:hypothetical protein